MRKVHLSQPCSSTALKSVLICRKAAMFSDRKFQADFLSALESELNRLHPS